VNQAPVISKRLSAVVSRRESFALALSGEAGLGKSHALDQLLNNLACRSVQLAANANGLVIARSLIRHDRMPVWAIRTLERLEAGETLEAARLSDAITAHLVSSAPFVVRLEDLHEANPIQLEVWAGVARSLKGTRGVALLAAGRGVPPLGFEEVRLEPLDLQACRVMLEAQIGAELPEQALDWIQARANGNPLFTLEYFRFLARSGFLWSDARRWRWRDPGSEVMPTSVEALVAQTLEPLRHEPLLQTVLKARAILPDDQAARWASVAELTLDQLALAQTRLEAEGFLQAGALQPIVVSVIRATLDPLERRDLTRRAIRELERDWPVAAALLVDDANLEPSEAMALLERGAAACAGQAGAGLSGERQAASFLVQAAERATPDERARRSLEAARALRPFDIDEALRLVVLAGAFESNDQTTLLEAELLAAQGRFPEAERCARRLSPASQVRWLEVLLEARYQLDDDAGVLEIWESNPVLQQAGLALRVRVGYALTQLGRFAEARELYATMLKTAPKTAPKNTAKATTKNVPQNSLSAEDHAWVLSAAAIVELDAGDLKAAAKGFSQALEAFDALEQPSPESQLRRIAALSNRMTLQYRLGQFDAAIQDLEAVLAHHSASGDGRNFAEAQSKLGTYLIAQAKFERAEEVLLEARGVLERITIGSGSQKGENPRALCLAEQGLVQLYLEWGPPHGAALALRHAQAAERAARQIENPANLTQTLFFCAWAEAVHGRPERAHSLSEELERLAERWKLEPMRIAAIWVRGLSFERSGRQLDALGQISLASEQMNALGHGPYAQRLALEADRIRGDQESARTRSLQLHGFPGWYAVACRYFPNLLEPGSDSVSGQKSASRTKAQAAPNQGATQASIRASTQASNSGSASKLLVLGHFKLEVNDQTITPPALQGKILLALLLEARITGRDGVKTLELLDALYPEHEESMGIGALKQLVFRTRASLGKAAILRISDGYALGAIQTDAEVFLRAAATHLWRGPVLNDLPEDIASALRDALGQALQLSSESLLESDPLEAARLAEIIREADPYNLSALRLNLRALEAAAEMRKIERTYALARTQLSDVGEDLPESWEAFLRQS
jgi:tetratricopeptide (TPR) repeat protein